MPRAAHALGPLLLSFQGPLAVRLGYDTDLLRACVQRSLAGPHLAPAAEPVTPPPLTMSAFGMHVHAATTVEGRDRPQLERLCRYLLRPPFAHDAVRALEGGRVRVHFKAPWRSGVAHADMTPDKFLARLCALVPPPGFHMTRYFGVFASHHHLRTRIVPPAADPAPELQLALALDLAGAANASGEPADASPRPRRLAWAALLARVFAIDVTVCRKCGGRRSAGVFVPVRAEVAQLDCLSAHADQRELVAWLGAGPRPRKIFLVHGEPGALDALRVAIHEQLGWDAVPDYRDTVDL